MVTFAAGRQTPPRYAEIRIDRIGVVVPAHNEEESLEECLDALVVSAAGVEVPVTIMVVLDSCTDSSSAVVDEFASRRVTSIALNANSVGSARAAGMAVLLDRHGESGTWLATTDADSIVPPNWLAVQLRHAEQGARVVAGTVTVEDWGERGNAVRDRARRDYRATSHNHIHGANLSFGATAYRAAGGFQPIASDEDVQLVHAFRVNAEPITWATDLPVVTSARRRARAPRGFASYLSTLEKSLQSSPGA